MWRRRLIIAETSVQFSVAVSSPDYPDWRQLQLPAVWSDNRLHQFYPFYWSTALPANAQKLPHRYSISQHSHILLLKVCFHSFHTHHPPLRLHLNPNRSIKKICHGRGTSSRAEWICQNRTERGKLRGAAAVFCSLLTTVGEIYDNLSLKSLYQNLTNTVAI